MLATALLLYLEGSLFAEIAKWVVMGIVLLGVLYGTFYALIGVTAARFSEFKKRHEGEKHLFWKYIKREYFSKKTIWED